MIWACKTEIFSKTFFLSAIIISIFPYYKSKEVFCLERWLLALFYPSTVGNQYFELALKKGHATKSSFKKLEGKKGFFLYVQKHYYF